ncbi:MAG: hypothetical protein PHI63_05920 [Patescibacteria group bacterium]|nr:hypothetical protein [Patescibacteria group bacterium]
MKLEQQVCDLKLAKRLKELGVPQESLFWWRTTKNDPSDVLILDMRDAHSRYFDYVSAFTVAELEDLMGKNGIEKAYIMGYGNSLTTAIATPTSRSIPRSSRDMCAVTGR